MMSGGKSSSRYPFTASQWQELEHQALIFKYMASGIPIPHDLIVSIRRSFLLDSSSTSPSLAFSPHTQLGWSCFQMGYGRKTEDPEPGRCRRTDGKKWRCSKEAYPDSKYCERHMHRGKNRSRKPVEISLASKTNHSSSSSSSSANLSFSTPETCHGLLCPVSSSSVTSPFQLGEYRRSSSEFKAQWMSSMAKAKLNNYSLSKEEEEERQRPLRHFFDECPERNKDQWMNMEDETQLSISFPK